MNVSRLSYIAVLVLTLTCFSHEGLGAESDIGNMKVTVKQLQDAVVSRTLTWLTGGSGNNDYISVGRTANYFGFVGMRVASGQSLSRSDVANDTLSVLNDVQRNSLIELVEGQKEAFALTQEARFKINRALEDMLIGEEISKDAFLNLGREYGSSEAELGRVLGQRLGEVAQTLTPDQRHALFDIRAVHLSGQGRNPNRQRMKLKLPKQDKKELVNIAARFLSWTTGSEEYNDFEVVGKPSQHFGFVSLRVDSNHGVRRGEIAKEVWAMLTAEQRKLLSAAAIHDASVFKEFLAARAKLMRTLETALNGETIDAKKARLYGGDVGEIEATMTWSQATAMIGVRNIFSENQSSQLLSIRRKYTPKDLSNDLFDRGRQLFAQCVLCHNITGQQDIAPVLHDVIGREVASESSFDGYSQALIDFGNKVGNWDKETLNLFLTSPKSLVPGTYMGYDGLENPVDREAILVFLESLD